MRQVESLICESQVIRTRSKLLENQGVLSLKQNWCVFYSQESSRNKLVKEARDSTTFTIWCNTHLQVTDHARAGTKAFRQVAGEAAAHHRHTLKGSRYNAGTHISW